MIRAKNNANLAVTKFLSEIVGILCVYMLQTKSIRGEVRIS